MVVYCTDSDPIEIGDLVSKVKVTVTENVSQNYHKILLKVQMLIFYLIKVHHLIEPFIAVILIPYMTILYENYSRAFSITQNKKYF